MSELTEQVVAELCAYLGNDTCTTTETADKLIALVIKACIDALRIDLPNQHEMYWQAIYDSTQLIRALGEVKE